MSVQERAAIGRSLRIDPAAPAQPSSTSPPAYNVFSMKAYVYVSLKKSVLDPQGKTIQGALKKMGYKGLEAFARASISNSRWMAA